MPIQNLLRRAAGQKHLNKIEDLTLDNPEGNAILEEAYASTARGVIYGTVCGVVIGIGVSLLTIGILGVISESQNAPIDL